MTAPTYSTAHADQPDRLSFHRLRRLDNVAKLATALTAVGAVLAWLAITQWYPDTFLPQQAQHGLRFWTLAAVCAWALLRTVESVWDRTHGETRLAAGAATPIPIGPLGTWLTALAVLVSIPLWPRVVTAFHTNNADVLFTLAVAEQAALLAAPVISLAVLAHGVIAGVGELRWRLHHRQLATTAAPAYPGPSGGAE